MMIAKFKQPEFFFEFRQIVFLILLETLDDFADAVIHERRHESEAYISVRFNEKARAASTTGDTNWMPDQNLVFMTDWHLKDYLEWREARIQAKADEDDDDDDEDQDDGDDNPPDASPEIEFSVN